MSSRRSAWDSTRKWDPESQRRFWNEWDRRYLQADTLGEQALRRGQVVIDLIRALGIRHLRILEIGCGNGWLVERLQEFGPVVGVDISNVAIDEARRQFPTAQFETGDILTINLPPASFDVVVSLETLSHVADQKRFIEIAAAALRCPGHLIIATQNRTIYLRRSDVGPPAPGQVRRWLTQRELRDLLRPQFRCCKAFTIEPAGDLGFLGIANSRLLNSMLLRFMSRGTIQTMKERLGWGQTIVALGEKETGDPGHGARLLGSK